MQKTKKEEEEKIHGKVPGDKQGQQSKGKRRNSLRLRRKRERYREHATR